MKDQQPPTRNGSLETPPRNQPRVEPQTSEMLLGALVGGLVTALIRGAFTYRHVHVAGVFGGLATLPSVGIGFVCGAIAGVWCRPAVGAIVGALTSAGILLLFSLPINFLVSLFGGSEAAEQLTATLAFQKALAGAIGGGAGGLVGYLAVRKRTEELEGAGTDGRASRPDALAKLVSVPTAAQANLIAEQLRSEGLEVTTTGEYTAGFQAAAPGEVSVLVHERDLPLARKALDAGGASE